MEMFKFSIKYNGCTQTSKLGLILSDLKHFINLFSPTLKSFNRNSFPECACDLTLPQKTIPWMEPRDQAAGGDSQ